MIAAAASEPHGTDLGQPRAARKQAAVHKRLAAWHLATEKQRARASMVKSVQAGSGWSIRIGGERHVRG
jgi:hypothetical protein